MPARRWLVAGAAACWAAGAVAQVNIEAFRDYFLVGQFGEVCTMCEVVVLCEAGDDAPAHAAVPERGTFTLYHLETRTFWSQVSTIWEWFIANFSSESLAARGHARPVNVYRVRDGEWLQPETIEGRLVLEPGVLEFGAHVIDRRNRAWRGSGSGELRGYCQRLPLWESLERIAAATGGTGS